MTLKRVYNVRHRCTCGLFVRRDGISTTAYACARCGIVHGQPTEEQSGEARVDVVQHRGAGHVTGQEEFDLYYASHDDRILGDPCRPLKCPTCGRFSSGSWSTTGRDTPSGYWQEWGGVCSTHGRWADST